MKRNTNKEGGLQSHVGAETNWASGGPPTQGGEEEEEDGRTGPAYCPPAARRGVKEFPCAHGHRRPTWATGSSPWTPGAHWPPYSWVRARLPLRK